MISTIPTETKKSRAFGWVQDPSDFRSLCNIVAAFVKGSPVHTLLVCDKIPRLVEIRDGRKQLLTELNSETTPLKLSYRALVGTSFIPRASARCNGIVQAIVKGQKREFIGNWPSDNFIRWAHALGFIKYDYTDDTFSITDLGLQLVAENNGMSEEISEAERLILIEAVLSYPPAIRVLSLLSEKNSHLTKFEIGRQLGFIGEEGFTSLPQDLLVMELSQTTDKKQRNTMNANWEGSSDKYARMIAKWLCNMGLLQIVPKEICVKRGNVVYKDTIPQAYMITLSGLKYFNAAKGKSRHKRKEKNVYFELFSPTGKDREYLRLRRSYILKFISEHHNTAIEQIKEFLSSVNISESAATILDDVKGLINIGIDIVIDGDKIIYQDLICDFPILVPIKKDPCKSESSEIKEALREKLTVLPHEYLALIDLAFDSNQSRLFEMKTIALFIHACGFEGEHLGGSRRPDGVLYTVSLEKNYGIIVDTKAYSDGYNLPIPQADEMSRYIRENQNRDEIENPNKWWEHFDPCVIDFTFLFVSSYFKGRFEDQLQRIAYTTQTNGAALSVIQMLLCANMFLTGKLDLMKLREQMFLNKEYLTE